VSLLQWQFTRFSHEPSLIRIFYDLSLFTTLTTTAKMICTADRMKRILYVYCLMRMNIYYMPETMKIWAETRSSLNIWSWIERACLNDKNSESALMTKPIVDLLTEFVTRSEPAWTAPEVSLLQWHRTTRSDLLVELVTRRQALLHACSRHEQNKPCYMRVVGTNR